MRPEQQALIAVLSEKLFLARQKKEGLAMRNIYGLSQEENIKAEQEFQFADAEYLEACANLEAAKRPEPQDRS